MNRAITTLGGRSLDARKCVQQADTADWPLANSLARLRRLSGLQERTASQMPFHRAVTVTAVPTFGMPDRTMPDLTRHRFETVLVFPPMVMYTVFPDGFVCCSETQVKHTLNFDGVFSSGAFQGKTMGRRKKEYEEEENVEEMEVDGEEQEKEREEEEEVEEEGEEEEQQQAEEQEEQKQKLRLQVSKSELAEPLPSLKDLLTLLNADSSHLILKGIVSLSLVSLCCCNVAVCVCAHCMHFILTSLPHCRIILLIIEPC